MLLFQRDGIFQAFYIKQNIEYSVDSLIYGENILRLILAVILGMIVGFERELAHKPAGLRTHMLVCLGSCLFTVISLEFAADPARIASGIVAGIGFIGAGAIIAEPDRVVGITTAASLWMTAAIGLTIGVGNYVLAAVAVLLALLTLFSRALFKKYIK
ncbi:MAG TPA: MgtC/SapB family protein [Candidatus Bathyarchaeota archaeon]|nr:MgtC/SapB family protein [Candidatus Bathyarchaeota archaeon]